jgi:hypothetical protein
MNETYTITFGDQAENHVGMEKIGSLAKEGFTLNELRIAKAWFDTRNVTTNVYDLGGLVTEITDDAYLLVAKNGLSTICDPNAFFLEQQNLEKDTKAFMYGRVVNKKARHNLCFDDISSLPAYESGKGRVVSFNDTPLLKCVRETLPFIIGDKACSLKAEGNYYYDINKCGIGFHGDAERRLVIGVRTGSTLPLSYRWYINSKPFGPFMDFTLSHGDIYIMSEKAVGTDWKKRKISTLRHAAGCSKFISH